MKVITALLCLFGVIVSSVVGMVYGWGLTPESIGWIVTSYIGTVVFTGISACVTS